MTVTITITDNPEGTTVKMKAESPGGSKERDASPAWALGTLAVQILGNALESSGEDINFVQMKGDGKVLYQQGEKEGGK